MPLDALCMTLLARELEGPLVGSRIDKIHQPTRDEALFTLRGQEGGHRLLLSANPARPRAQLTELPRENPQNPPMFCMLLRKYLTGGRILAITQPPMERLLEFQIESADELGDRSVKRLILEAMGRHANLILVDAQGRIVDCLRRVSSDLTAQRQLLPGMFYRLPPTQEKRNPMELTEGDIAQLLPQMPQDRPMEKWLVETFGGISPLIARELAFEAAGETDALIGDRGEDLLRRFLTLLDKVREGRVSPTILLREGKPADFSFRPILQYGLGSDLRPEESFSRLFDRFYETRETQERVRQKGQDLHKSLTNAQERLRRKLGFQEKELEATRDREALREKGDLITANLYRMEKGMMALETENFYDPECGRIVIPLDPLRSPQQNAARYYKDYTRAKTAQEMLARQIQKGREELRYLQSVLESLERAQGERDLEEIRRELEEEGFLRSKREVKGKLKRPASRPMEFRSGSGLRICVGRNNSQNDALTTKLAGKGDLWFHTQKIHGAHVILWTEGRAPDEKSILEAATLAAYYSQGREGGKVPVDYTPVKFVKKPAGARPGMVVYTTYETLIVTPEEALVKTLSAEKQ